MTEEDTFHEAMAANPECVTTRLVYADWLAERDDPREQGYRWLAATGKTPRFNSYTTAGAMGRSPIGCWEWWSDETKDVSIQMNCRLDGDLLGRLESVYKFFDVVLFSVDFLTLRDALDAVANAIATQPLACEAA